MTKKDAIDIIKSECYVFNPLNFDRSTMVNTALDMAVKALEQEPCEDAISREAVHDLMAIWLSDYLLDETREALEVIDAKVEDLPSVTPRQRQRVGHWKKAHDDIMQWWACSECGKPCPKATYGGDFFSDYCPSCGAKMEESEE